MIGWRKNWIGQGAPLTGRQQLILRASTGRRHGSCNPWLVDRAGILSEVIFGLWCSRVGALRKSNETARIYCRARRVGNLAAGSACPATQQDKRIGALMFAVENDPEARARVAAFGED